MIRHRILFIPILLICVIVAWAVRSSIPRDDAEVVFQTPDDLDQSISALNKALHARWLALDMQPAKPASELQIFRRLSLALHSTSPSLEEIRRFERDTQPHRLRRWTSKLLGDSRYSDAFAERLTRSLVGTDDGTFLVYRRDQFVAWMKQQLTANRNYSAVVREILSAEGLWTGKPATNFVISAYANKDLDEAKLASRTVRVFLGQRMDCAQCHDHPFDDTWKQTDFEGLAAFFGQTSLGFFGIENLKMRNNQPVEFEIEDRVTQQKRTVFPKVPYHADWLPSEGSRRMQLAHWITHPENRRFERATVNRIWGLIFGSPYLAPVDDLPHPDDDPDVLDVLGHDFRIHGYDLKHLIQVIAASDAFLLDSRYPEIESFQMEQVKSEWAVFPLVRLRPDQVIGAMFQASSIRTIDQQSHLLTRFKRFTSEREFINEYGDLGDRELEQRSGTIPQALLRMNGKIANEAARAELFNAAGSIAGMTQSDAECVDASFLVCLTRRPDPSERDHFVRQLSEAHNNADRKRVVEDMFWALFNAPEFSWNH
ncbi:MAG: DUF1549 domain-containing protein [Planctomycetaceae bacterium]